jgi:hypothetical protein
MHGIPQRREPDPPPQAEGGDFRIVMNFLLREAVVGCVLVLLLGRDPNLNLVLSTIVFAGVLAFTNRHGLLLHRNRLDIVTETFAVFMGALAFRKILAMTTGFWGWH